MLVSITPSTRRGKRYVARFEDGTKTHFGQSGGSTYIDHGDKAKRTAYIARHRVNEDWTKPKTAGALSRFILWGDHTTLEQNRKDFNRRFYK
jgi:hypothetical protein